MVNATGVKWHRYQYPHRPHRSVHKRQWKM